MKTYVLTISEKFPKTHPKSGEPTNFLLSIKYYDKIHTIRGNYDLWSKRFEKINAGEAVLSVRVWEGKPYNSKQREIFRYDYRRNIGIEKVTFRDYLYDINVNGSSVDVDDLAKNDGLSYADFEHWFKGYDFSKPMAVIHFTDFRYGGNGSAMM
jgi:hypothetical protein